MRSAWIATSFFVGWGSAVFAAEQVAVLGIDDPQGVASVEVEGQLQRSVVEILGQRGFGVRLVKESCSERACQVAAANRVQAGKLFAVRVTQSGKVCSVQGGLFDLVSGAERALVLEGACSAEGLNEMFAELARAASGRDEDSDCKSDPKGAAGFAIIGTNPAATIYVGHKRVGGSPTSRIELAPGCHRVRAVAEDGRTVTHRIMIESNKMAVFKFDVK